MEIECTCNEIDAKNERYPLLEQARTTNTAPANNAKDLHLRLLCSHRPNFLQDGEIMRVFPMMR